MTSIIGLKLFIIIHMKNELQVTFFKNNAESTIFTILWIHFSHLKYYSISQEVQ